jgi:3(or 17)beta-hydroxysteroid dehydrogenase
MGRVQDKRVIVTGAASGLGKATAELLAAEGAKLVLADIDEEAGRALAEALPAAVFVPCDVGSERDWKEVFATADTQWGGVDVLVNNAGVAIFATIEKTTLEQWEYINRVNSTSVFLGCKYAIAAMKENGGSIVNMSSIGSHVGIPLFAAYTATKGSVRSLTKSVAVHCQDQGYPIRCNSVHPGVIDTPMGQKAAADADAEDLELLTGTAAVMGEPIDVAYAILYLASDESKFTNGSEMLVDNGMSAS